MSGIGLIGWRKRRYQTTTRWSGGTARGEGAAARTLPASPTPPGRPTVGDGRRLLGGNERHGSVTSTVIGSSPSAALGMAPTRPMPSVAASLRRIPRERLRIPASAAVAVSPLVSYRRPSPMATSRAASLSGWPAGGARPARGCRRQPGPSRYAHSASPSCRPCERLGEGRVRLAPADRHERDRPPQGDLCLVGGTGLACMPARSGTARRRRSA